MSCSAKEPSSFVSVVFANSGTLTSAPPIGRFVESVTTPMSVAVVTTPLCSSSSTRANRAAAGTRSVACPLAASLAALNVSATSSGTPHSANRPRASAVTAAHRGACGSDEPQSPLTVAASDAAESPAILIRPSTIPPLPYPLSPHAAAAICNALGTRTAIVVAPATVTDTE
jgi:hypothetical protein